MPTKFWKVMILVMSVCHSVHWEFHVTIIHDVLDLTVQGPAPLIGPFVTRPQPPLYKSPAALLKTFDCQDWIPVRTCSLQDASLYSLHWCWYLVGGYIIQWASGRHASYWNAFLLFSASALVYSTKSKVILLQSYTRKTVRYNLEQYTNRTR